MTWITALSVRGGYQLRLTVDMSDDVYVALIWVQPYTAHDRIADISGQK